MRPPPNGGCTRLPQGLPRLRRDCCARPRGRLRPRRNAPHSTAGNAKSAPRADSTKRVLPRPKPAAARWPRPPSRRLNGRRRRLPSARRSVASPRRATRSTAARANWPKNAKKSGLRPRLRAAWPPSWPGSKPRRRPSRRSLRRRPRPRTGPRSGRCSRSRPGSRRLSAGCSTTSCRPSSPPALQRSLAFAGWVEHGVDGAAVQASLLPGQRIVDTAGRQWRWDGFTRPAGTSAAAQQLRHRNRLAALVREIAAARMAAENAESEHATLAAAVADATETERRLRLQVQEAETALSRARAAESELARRALTAETRLEAAADTVAKLTADLAAAQQEAAEIARRLAELPQATPVAATLEEARAAVGRARAAETEAQAGISQLRQESRFRRERLTAIQRETVAWRERRDQAAAQHATLDERCRRLEAELAALAERPSAIA